MAAYDKKTLGNRMRVLRAGLRMSQDDLARKVHMNASAIWQYEAGIITPGADKVWNLALALGCTPNYLLGWPDGEREVR
ncbi:MAG: helix-turn-helix domain-containing protein [Coriobacteriaceae bacterium]|nr:helix-turn-helix domain-containing protein [Coriobacteriaceae bacterium]